ncbi:hypothetical protein GCM10009682_58370 [Luedemannella flava]|uniref:Aromatic ring-opening dioxygenase LigA n=2 Tax=Luedemannella flava TaxID=349316 RepID=A0ABN2MMN8_9ACTN
MPVLLYAVGAILVVAGPVLVVSGRVGRTQVQRELSDQHIVFPPADDLPAGLNRYGGVQVTTGAQARAYSEIIGQHVAAATKGRTYAQITEEWQAGGRTDERLGKLRETAFMGNSLRGALLGAYQAWQVTALVAGLGALFTAIGVVFVALGATWPL